jgi:biopolymer transport protein ExbB
MEHSLWQIIEESYSLWVIMAFSVVALAVAIERLGVQWKFLDRARALADTVHRCLGRGALEEGRSACERSRSPLADVFLVGYERMGRSKKASLEAAVNRERLRVIADLKTRLWILGTIGATAPFVGLFGTVVGILLAFGDIAEAGGGGLAVVSAGISEALYATAAGILVAVEAVIIYNFLNQRLARIALELKMLTDEFLELLDEHDPSGASAGRKPERSEEGRDGAREAA